MLEVSGSVYNGRDDEPSMTRHGRATTTYALVPGHPATGPEHIVLEPLYGQPTHWPVDRRMDGLDGDLDVALEAQRSGRRAAAAYSLRHGENTGDKQDNIGRLARAMRRMREVLTARQAS